MNIGIDIDGVLIDLEKYMINYGTKMCIEERWPIEVEPEEYQETKMFNWTKQQAEKFWNKYLENYVLNAKPREFASEVIKKMKNKNHNIYIITARNEEGLPPNSYGKMQEFTKQWLEKNKIEYNQIIFVPDQEKLSQCIKNKIDIMIEDSPQNIVNIASKIPVIKYECQYNKKIIGKNIITAYSWYHIYDIINKK